MFRELYLKWIIKRFQLSYKFKTYKKHTRKLHNFLYNSWCILGLICLVHTERSLLKVSPIDVLLIGLTGFLLVILLDILYLIITYRFNREFYRGFAINYYVSLRTHGFISENELAFIIRTDRYY